MSKEYKGDYVKTERVRCDVCGKLQPKNSARKAIQDTRTASRIDVCSWKCADEYWHRYQLALPPSSNTGVQMGKSSFTGIAK